MLKPKMNILRLYLVCAVFGTRLNIVPFDTRLNIVPFEERGEATHAVSFRDNVKTMYARKLL